jgi:chromosome segregation ATPase
MKAILSEESKNKQKGFKMDEMVKELMSKVAALESKLAALEAELGKKKEEVVQGEKKLGDSQKELGEMQKKLSEGTTKIKELEGKIELAEKEKVFTEYLSKGKILPAQKEAFMKMDVKLAEELFGKVEGKINLNEKGNSGEGNKNKGTKDIQDEIHDEAVKLSESRKISLSDAYSAVLNENEELSKKYDDHVNKAPTVTVTE